MGAIRLFLACGVVILHLNEQVLDPLGLHADSIWVSNLTGGRAVIFFYIVSGFLISYVLNDKYPQSAAAPGFPPLALPAHLSAVVGSSVLLRGDRPAAVDGPRGRPTGPRRAADRVRLDRGAVALPRSYWSLFPACGPKSAGRWALEPASIWRRHGSSRSNRLALTLFAGSIAVRALALWMIAPDDPAYKTWTYLFFPSILFFFLLGHMAERLHRSRPIGLPTSVALLIAAAAAATRLDHSTSVGGPWFHVAALCFAAALPGIFAATRDNRLSTFLGDLTYPLYLTHCVLFSEVFSSPQSKIGATLIAASGALDSIELKSLFLTGSTLALALCVAAATRFAIELPIRAAFAWLLESGGRKIPAPARSLIGTSALSDTIPPRRG